MGCVYFLNVTVWYTTKAGSFDCSLGEETTKKSPPKCSCLSSSFFCPKNTQCGGVMQLPRNHALEECQTQSCISETLQISSQSLIHPGKHSNHHAYMKSSFMLERTFESGNKFRQIRRFKIKEEDKWSLSQRKKKQKQNGSRFEKAIKCNCTPAF